MKIYTKTDFIVLVLILFVISTLSACKNSYSIPPESDFNTTNNSNSVYTYEYYEFELSKGESMNETISLKANFDIPMEKGYYRIIHFGLTSNIFIIE